MSKSFEVVVTVRLTSSEHNILNDSDAENLVVDALNKFNVVHSDVECLGVQCTECGSETPEEEIVKLANDDELCESCAEDTVSMDISISYCDSCHENRVIVNIRGDNDLHICTVCGRDI